MGRYINVTADVEVDLSDIDTEDLIDELETRGRDDMRNLLETIWLKRLADKDYQNELDKLIYGVLGKIV